MAAPGNAAQESGATERRYTILPSPFAALPAPIDPSDARDFALLVVQRLRDAGYQALWAGGCVRDLLLGFTPKDYDVATSARPDEVRTCFGHRRTIAVGAAFGVISVLGPRGAGQVEVATFRRDSPYSDGRRPDSVTYSSAEFDAQRRDFTINGLFYDPLEHRVIDYVDGQRDIQRGVIRAIGDAHARLDEDRLRLLRAVRFTATYGFRMDEETFAAVRNFAGKIVLVSAERIAGEVRRMLQHPSRRQAVELLEATDLLTHILPEASEFRDARRWNEALEVLDALPEQVEFVTVLAGLLEPLGGREPAELARRVAERWRLSKHERESVAWILVHLPTLLEADRCAWSVLQPLLVDPRIDDALPLLPALLRIRSLPDEPLRHIQHRLALPPEQLDPPPLIGGNDLKQAGLRGGPVFSRILQQVRADQLDGRITTRQQALDRATQLYHENQD